MPLVQALLALALAGPGRCVEVVAMADVHGHAGDLAALAPAVRLVRARGPSLLLDAGDGLQGTVEASLSRGRVVVAAFAAMGVDAAALGNHDFDYGLAALRERAAEAPYPLLAANLRDRSTGRRPDWANLQESRLFRLPGGPVVGVFGIAAEDTPSLTMPRNVEGLTFSPEAAESIRAARDLRTRGAEVVIGLVHAGGHCRDLGDPDDVSSCDSGAALFRLARALPPGLVDALLGGHTHGFVNHRVNGIALVQAGARAESAGWLTLCAGEPARFHPPLRRGDSGKGGDSPADALVAAAVAPDLEAAEAARRRPLGIRLPRPLTRDPARESTLGAAAAQAVRAALRTDFALVNGGGLRTDLPSGELTFGQLYEAFPFDDELAAVTVTGAQLLDILRALASGNKGFPQLAGLAFDGRGAWTCRGTPLDPARTYLLGTNEFLATGGDGTRRVIERLPAGAVRMREDLRFRDVFADWLRSAPLERPLSACP